MQTNIVFFLNDVSGGVASVVNNLLKYIASQDIKFRVILTYNAGKCYETNRIKGFSNVHEVERFVYRRNENFYTVCKRLNKLIEPGDVIVANDCLELALVSNMGLQNKVVYILHGDYDYYYELAEKNQLAIDTFICVSKHIEDKLKNKLPNRLNNIFYLPHAIPEVKAKIKYNNSKPLSIIFIGRLTTEKGYHLLPEINSLLIKRNINVNWYIAGVCSNIDIEWKRWKDATNVHFLEYLSNDVLLNTLSQHDLFILPSHAEGFPVALIESMKAGLVPLVSNLPSGVPELIENGVTGYSFPIGNANAYVNAISKLNQNRLLLSKIGQNALKKATMEFNPYTNAKAYELLFLQTADIILSHHKEAKRVYGSRLDYKLIPNFITKLIRNILS